MGALGTSSPDKVGAAADIANLVKQRALADGICNVIIAGGTCSGKTTLAESLREQISKEHTVTVIKQDDYFKDIQDVPKIRKGYLMDSPNAFHASEFRQDAELLLRAGSAALPLYDIARNKRVSKDVPVTRSEVNIFEGLHTIKFLEGLPNALTIFLATPLETCLERRVSRDVRLYGIAQDRIREHFADCIAPMYHSYIAPQMEKAELVP